MPSLLAEIWRYSLRLSPVLIAFGILIVLLERWSDSETSTGSTFGLTAVSYLAHRFVLFDLRFGRWGKMEGSDEVAVPPEAIGRFLVVSLIHTFVGLIVAILVASAVAEVVANPGAAFWLMLISASLVSWVLLTFFGTIYPAAASHEFPSLGRAFRAGRKTWFSVAWQLLLIPGLYGFVITVLALVAIPTVGKADRWAPASIALDSLFFAAQLEIQVMVAVILTRAYRRAW